MVLPKLFIPLHADLYLTTFPKFVAFKLRQERLHRNIDQFKVSKSKLGFYVPFNIQGHIGRGPQHCHLWGVEPTQR